MKLDICELGAECECAIADGLEVFVADDALEGGAFGKRTLTDASELIGEGYALEDGATTHAGVSETGHVIVNIYAPKEQTALKRAIWNARQPRTFGEVDPKEGINAPEGRQIMLPPQHCHTYQV